MKDLKIDSIKTYEAVTFEKKLQKFFSASGTANHQSRELHIIENVGVHVKSNKDSVIIPFPNISGIYLDTTQKKEARESHKESVKAGGKPRQPSRIK